MAKLNKLKTKEKVRLKTIYFYPDRLIDGKKVSIVETQNKEGLSAKLDFYIVGKDLPVTHFFRLYLDQKCSKLKPMSTFNSHSASSKFIDILFKEKDFPFREVFLENTLFESFYPTFKPEKNPRQTGILGFLGKFLPSLILNSTNSENTDNN